MTIPIEPLDDDTEKFVEDMMNSFKAIKEDMAKREAETNRQLAEMGIIG